jgi:hypothetical protein
MEWQVLERNNSPQEVDVDFREKDANASLARQVFVRGLLAKQNP